jgi:hypothetical protein
MVTVAEFIQDAWIGCRRHAVQGLLGRSSLSSRRHVSITVRACKQMGEPVFVEALVAQAAVERFDVGVMVGLAQFDQPQLYTALAHLRDHRLAAEHFVSTSHKSVPAKNRCRRVVLSTPASASRRKPMICSSEKRFFTSNPLCLGNWTPKRPCHSILGKRRRRGSHGLRVATRYPVWGGVPQPGIVDINEDWQLALHSARSAIA